MSTPAKLSKEELLARPIEHIRITERPEIVDLVEAMEHMALSARDLHRAAKIYDRMLRDEDCAVILCLAGSLISAGLKQVFIDMIRNKMADVVVATGANIVDQDFLEALGFRHYVAPDEFRSGVYDGDLRALHIDRIYDTFIDEDELRVCDETIKQIADSLEPRPYSSREFITRMGAYLSEQGSSRDSVVLAAYECGVPIFCPAFSDSSAGLGIVLHYKERGERPKTSFDSAKDFYELTQVKIHNPVTGLLMLGGGVPKNFAQDVVVAADIMGEDSPMHKYAIQITVADERDGALSGSTLKEASSWGKVDTVYEQMVYSEATLAVPLLAGYGYHGGGWRQRSERRFNEVLDKVSVSVGAGA